MILTLPFLYICEFTSCVGFALADNLIRDMNNTSFEPMDVDLSSNSVTLMDISFNEPSQEFIPVPVKEEPKDQDVSTNVKTGSSLTSTQKPSVKIYHIVKKNEKKITFNSTHIMVSLVIVTCLSVALYDILSVSCSADFDLAYLSEKLQRKVYGQHMAIADIINTMKDESRSKILFFYGGTGVGKTYTVSLMLENSWNYTNVYHYTMPSFLTTFTTELMLGLTMCKTTIFVVDDLKPTDIMHIHTHIKDVVQKSNDMNKNILIILVFNCDNTEKDLTMKCDNTFYKELGISFKNINAFKQYVKFEELSEHHLKKCIEDELGKNIMNEDNFKNILKNFNVTLDGCKGVHKKLKILSL